MCRPRTRGSGCAEQTDLAMCSQSLRYLWMGWRERQVHTATRDRAMNKKCGLCEQMTRESNAVWETGGLPWGSDIAAQMLRTNGNSPGQACGENRTFPSSYPESFSLPVHSCSAPGVHPTQSSLSQSSPRASPKASWSRVFLLSRKSS